VAHNARVDDGAACGVKVLLLHLAAREQQHLLAGEDDAVDVVAPGLV